MSHTIALPDDVYQSLEEYARQQKQTPEEVIAAWALAARDQIQQKPPERSVQQPEIQDPFEGFYGAFEADYPDLVARHDYYIGQEALNPHTPASDGNSVDTGNHENGLKNGLKRGN